MGTVYTLGVWRVKPGREEEFVRLWRELGERTLPEFPDAHGTLLRDQADPCRFVSFGPWDSAEQIARWRASAAFQESVGALREVLDGFEPGSFDLVTQVGG